MNVNAVSSSLGSEFSNTNAGCSLAIVFPLADTLWRFKGNDANVVAILLIAAYTADNPNAPSSVTLTPAFERLKTPMNGEVTLTAACRFSPSSFVVRRKRLRKSNSMAKRMWPQNADGFSGRG